MPTHPLDQVQLLIIRQPINSTLNQASKRNLVNGNKTVIIHVSEKSHDELAIHAIRNSAMAWNGIAKVFDLESSFEARGEEAAEGCD